MTTPYHGLPSYTRWKKAVAEIAPSEVDPVGTFSWKIGASDKVATAGSCFAQHIARYLRNSGFNYYVVEEGHPLGDEQQREKFNYGTFSARYGNIYTVRQLVQLFDRAYGNFHPSEPAWTNEKGRFIDPFRPAIEPDGFATEAELIADRDQHLAMVRKMFETLDIFVFTLGLTEAWTSKDDGAVFPLCPGVAGGVFDAEKYSFHNFRASEVTADLNQFIERLKKVNPGAKVILTVSPVPLAATAETRHVLTATTYSKAALRVACDEVAACHDNVAYFPSYEVITGSYNRGAYFASDLRSVTEEGVSHVMRLFLRHATEGGSVQAPAPAKRKKSFIDRMMEVVGVKCEEELLEASVARKE